MRISDNSASRLLKQNLERIRQEQFKRTRELSSGKRLHRPSQEPAASARVLRIREDLSRLNQYGRNLQRAQIIVNSSDEALNAARNRLNVALERATFALGAIVNQEQRDVIADEILEIRDDILSIANTIVDGRYIFSGTETKTEAVADSGGTFVYQGDSQAAQAPGHGRYYCDRFYRYQGC